MESLGTDLLVLQRAKLMPWQANREKQREAEKRKQQKALAKAQRRPAAQRLLPDPTCLARL